MKNRMLCFLLAGVLMLGNLSGAVSGTEFSDGEGETVVTVEEEEFTVEEEGIEEIDSFVDMETEDYEISVFSDGNAEMLTALDEASEELVEEIESGNIIGFAPVALTELETVGVMTLSIDQEFAAIASIPESTYTLFCGAAIFCDEVWTYDNAMYPAVENGGTYTDPRYRQCTVNRYIEYVDGEGNTRTSPMYCLEATQIGINPDPEGLGIKDEVISLITNSTMKKILYFGHGGPGDICDEYDPTCSHIDWSKGYNRFLFTHYALSKTYCGDVGYATAEEIEHVGLTKFISYLKSLAIPNRKAVTLSMENRDGNIITGKAINVDLSLHREKTENTLNNLDTAFDEGYQITPVIYVTDEGDAGNGMKITTAEDDEWQILYWKTREEYETSRGPNKPRSLTKGKSVTLKNGACFRIVFPENMKTKKEFIYDMSLYPVSFILMDGELQMGGSGFQDMGAYVYQDAKGKVKLNINPAVSGNLKIHKTDHYDGKGIKNVTFALEAAENLYSGSELIYSKGTIIESGITDENGDYLLENLIPGKYYLKETEGANGYLINETQYTINIKANEMFQQNVVNIPDISGYVKIEKFVEGTKLRLKDAQFTIYSWNAKNQAYDGKILQMNYSEAEKRYISPLLTYDEMNCGRFKIVETKNPQGYSGSWSKEFVLTNKRGTQLFEYSVTNRLAEKKIVEIQKVCSETGVTLTDAGFTLYEYSLSSGKYKNEGVDLYYDSTSGKYVSSELMVTDDNEGKYRVVETKVPKDYEGAWEQEIDILNIAQPLQFIVKNKPVDYPKGTLQIRKTDILTDKILKDAEFTIYEWNEEQQMYHENPFDCILMKYDSVSQNYVSGDLEINPYNNGKYKVVETKNPEGYTGIWEQEIRLTEINPNIYLEVENDPKDLPLGSITVTKKIKEEDIIWAHGNPVFHFVIEGIDLQGKYHRYENYVRYTKSNYINDGAGYAALSCVFSNIPLGRYEVYEKSVLRYYLKDAVANTSNVIITKGISPQYGTNPREIAYGTAQINYEGEQASITFINEKKRFDNYSHSDVIKNMMPAESIILA